MEVMRKIVGALHYARGLITPDSKYLKTVDSMFKMGAKDFMPDSETMKGGKMPPLNQIGRGHPEPSTPREFGVACQLSFGHAYQRPSTSARYDASNHRGGRGPGFSEDFECLFKVGFGDAQQ